MKVDLGKPRKARIEMLPLIDIVFLLLVFFIYAMLSMAVHHSLPVQLPHSSTAKLDKNQLISITVKADGSVFVDKVPVSLERLSHVLRSKASNAKAAGVLLFGDRELSYQKLFNIMDRIREAGLTRISLQAEVSPQK